MFAEETLNYVSNLIMFSFDVDSLFTNMPFQETIDVYVELWFNDKLNIDGFTINDFHKSLTVSMYDTLALFDDD